MSRADVVSWSSPFLRCKQTEALVLRHAFADAHAAVRRYESLLLREQEYGDWDGLTDDEIRRRYPEQLARKARLTNGAGRFYFRNPGVNYVAGFNVLSIVIELPESQLTAGGSARIGIWGTISR